MTHSMACLSSSSKLMTIVSRDNRIHLWDTGIRKEKRVYVEKNHLAHKYTCTDWRQITPESLGYYSVGCSDGIVIIWDLARGIVINTIKNGDDSIASITFSNDGSTIYVSDTQNYVNQYKTTEPEVQKSFKVGKRRILKMVMNPVIDVIAVASSSIKLVDVNTGRKKKLDMKFPGGVTGMSFSQCGCYLAVCIEDNREIFLFDVQSSAENSAPLYVYPVLDTPAGLTLRSTSQCVDVLCWFELGGGCVVRYNLHNNCIGSTNGLVPDEHNGHLEPSNVSLSPPRVNVCRVMTEAPVFTGCFGIPGTIAATGATLVLGQLSAPTTHHLEYESSSFDLSLFPDITISGQFHRELTSVEATTSSSVKKKLSDSKLNASQIFSETSTTAMLGPFDSNGRKRPLVDSDSVEIESSASIPVGTDGTVSTRKATKIKLATAIEPDTLITSSVKTKQMELTIEQRLNSLSAITKNVESDMRSSISAQSTLNNTQLPSSDSLAVLVQQALHAGDEDLLEQCLGCERAAVEPTVRNLPSARVLALLTKLTGKLEKRPSRGQQITIWLSSILKHHAAYLIGYPGVARQLAGLSQLLEQRVNTYSKLASLGGRLDLVLHHTVSLQSRASNSYRGNAEEKVTEPVSIEPRSVIYEETLNAEIDNTENDNNGDNDEIDDVDDEIDGGNVEED